MQLGRLDHVNVRTTKVEAMTRWYETVLGMRAGPRPNFPFPGAWLYVGDHPCIHLVGVAEEPANADPRLEHFAFEAKGLAAFIAGLDKAKIAHETRRVPGLGIVQVNVWDPDGNHIHIDFPPGEATGSADGWGSNGPDVTRKG
jgi:catechol 2,3-dioxygenase-like lactoylglutathione lyase family enzyme